MYEEISGFFPDNAVEYYVSYYDYYQAEAYLPQSDTYIKKDLAINEEIVRLGLAAVSRERENSCYKPLCVNEEWNDLWLNL